MHAIAFSKSDWDSYETSWDFTSLPLLNPDYRQPLSKSHLPEASRPLAGDDAGDAAAGGRKQPHLHRGLWLAG